ncbi:MAG: fatty acid desaturase [Alphaproteobacteria bacterium]|nr:fatty acid desaturase [Alphaproteobacteria bacterium]
MTETRPKQLRTRRQGVIGLGLASAIISAWLLTHIGAVFFYEWSSHSVATAPLLVVWSCWLYVGLFIVAHDCMHRSLVPARPTWNRAIGRLCLFLYAGFDFDGLNRKHHRHHRHSGTGDDPDFHPVGQPSFARWYLNFFLEYFSWPQAAFVAVISLLYVFVVGATYSNILVFWALPALLSSLQLFTFGTYLPHRPLPQPFTDHHRARTSNWNWLASLFTCYHFGYHHEHHLYPQLPWWRLPLARRKVPHQPPVDTLPPSGMRHRP